MYLLIFLKKLKTLRYKIISIQEISEFFIICLLTIKVPIVRLGLKIRGVNHIFLINQEVVEDLILIIFLYKKIIKPIINKMNIKRADFIQKGIKIKVGTLNKFQEINIPPVIEKGKSKNIPKIIKKSLSLVKYKLL